jgi:hypothetical protein
VPSFGTVSDVSVQLFGVSLVSHNFIDPKGFPGTDASFENGEMVWFTFHAPLEVSFIAPITVGV